MELEEERDKLKDEMASKSLSLSIVTTDVDSGCNSSVSTEGAADILELYQDFRKEKVADTKAKLQVRKVHYHYD